MSVVVYAHRKCAVVSNDKETGILVLKTKRGRTYIAMSDDVIVIK